MVMDALAQNPVLWMCATAYSCAGRLGPCARPQERPPDQLVQLGWRSLAAPGGRLRVAQAAGQLGGPAGGDAGRIRQGQPRHVLGDPPAFPGVEPVAAGDVVETHAEA